MLNFKTKNGAVRPRKFFWAVGIEDSFVPQGKTGLRPMDEYELTSIISTGAKTWNALQLSGHRPDSLGVPWYRVETAPGVYTGVGSTR